MFTGIIEKTGVVSSLEGKKLTLQARFHKISLGESVAVNGCCLTVVSKKEGRLVFDLSEETLQKTNLGQLKKGSKVNLERSLRAGDRLGGHFVLGHVDAVGKIISLKRLKSSLIMIVSFPQDLRPYMVEKGSVAVDGISLTLYNLEKTSFKVSIIPHTETYTSLHQKKVGDFVNLETDILAKYVQGLILKGKGW